MTMTKKKKRILLVAVPAILLVAVAGVILWLVLGQSEPYQPFVIGRNQSDNQINYCAVRGEVEQNIDTVSTIDLPCYGFSPPEDWVQTQDAMSTSSRTVNPGSPWYTDQYQDPQGKMQYFFQMPAAVLELTGKDPSGNYQTLPTRLLPQEIQEVWFGDTQVIYYQQTCTESVYEPDGSLTQQEVIRTGAYWVHEVSLLNLDCAGALDVNQMLELVSRVDYQAQREPVEVQDPIEPLRLQEGFLLVSNNPDGTTDYSPYPYASMGNPQVPDEPRMFSFTPPEDYTLDGQQEDPSGLRIQQKYVSSQGELISYSCCAGPSRFFQQDNQNALLYFPFEGMDMERLENDTVTEVSVNGNPAFVHINEDVAEIGWIDGYCTLEIRCTAPMTEEELIALAQGVK